MKDLRFVSDPETWFSKEEPKQKVKTPSRFKFRFWCKSEERYVSDPVIDKVGNVSCMDGIAGRDDCTDDIVVTQSTGLIDKNGIEIYEGDVVNFKEVYRTSERGEYEDGEGSTWQKIPIVWDQRNLRFSFYLNQYRGNEPIRYEWIEVIGNVFETSDIKNRQSQPSVI